ncbi:MAG: aminopeptidase P family protein [Bacteroidota bacterium]
MFSKVTYIERRKELSSKFENGILLFPGNGESPMNYTDNTYHFRQDSSFLYYFGLNRPNLVGIIDIDENKEFIFGNDFTIDDIIWIGSQATISKQSELVGIENTATFSEMINMLKSARQKMRKIHFLSPYRAETKIQLLNWLGIQPRESDKKASDKLTKAVINQRIYKSEEEITEIEKAVNITVDMHLAAMHMIKPGMSEAQIAAKVNGVALANNGNLSFPIIATVNGQTLHNHNHGNILSKGQMLLLDAGAETEMGYGGDMSSTIPVDLMFSNKQKEIYQIALSGHEAAIKALQPGIRFEDIHILAAKTIAGGLKDIGLMKGNIDEAIIRGAHALFFPCGLGHMMGLDIHDMENLGEEYVGYDGKAKSSQFGLKSLRLGRELEPGFVLTIEPGIYFIPELIDLWKSENKHVDFLNYDKIEEYRNFGGIRNEEDFLITETGYRLLGKKLPKTIDDVEYERAKPRI